MASNQGRELDQLLDDLEPDDLREAAKVSWIEARRHPGTATCECIAMEVLAVLYERGYRLVKQPSIGEEHRPWTETTPTPE